MKKLAILLLTSVVALGTVNAQVKIPVELEKHRVYLNILSPGISYELGLSERLSLHTSAGISFYWGDNDYRGSDPENYYQSLNPFINATLRNYYPRKRVKKELDFNSGNYIGAIGGYVFDAITEWNRTDDTQSFANSGFIGGVWGIQRNYKSGVHLGLSFGGGLSLGQNFDNATFIPVGGFEFGFALK